MEDESRLTNLDQLFEHAPDAVVLIRQDGTVAYLNDAARTWFAGTDAARSIEVGERYVERLRTLCSGHAESDGEIAAIGEALTAILDTARGARSCDLQTGSGDQRRWLSIAISACTHDARPAALIVQRDLTARRQQAQDLADEVTRLTLFTALTSDALALSEDGLLLDCNATLSRLIGYTREELIGRHIVTLVMEEDRDRVRAHVLKNSDAPYEHRMMRKDGSIFEAAVSARRVEYQGRTIRATSIRDLTQLRQAEQALHRAQEEKLHAQAMLLAELSTPLIPINDRVLVMPLIGSIDSQRAQQVLEALLSGIAQRRARIIIIDITGVRLVDSHVASTLVKAAQATRLLGAQVVLTGIRADVAQTLVRLGVELDELTTKATLQSGIAFAISHTA